MDREKKGSSKATEGSTQGGRSSMGGRRARMTRNRLWPRVLLSFGRGRSVDRQSEKHNRRPGRVLRACGFGMCLVCRSFQSGAIHQGEQTRRQCDFLLRARPACHDASCFIRSFQSTNCICTTRYLIQRTHHHTIQVPWTSSASPERYEAHRRFAAGQQEPGSQRMKIGGFSWNTG